MKFKTPHPLGLLLLAIPFLAMLYMVVSNELNYKNYPEYRVQVVGYDPVNILTGHYLTFRYQWPKDAKGQCAKDDCFACFSGPTDAPKITFTGKTGATKCEAALKLQSSGHTFASFPNAPDPRQPPYSLQTYHISEIEAPVLDQMLRQRVGKFEVGLMIFPDHSGQIKNLYIDNQQLSDFFK